MFLWFFHINRFHLKTHCLRMTSAAGPVAGAHIFFPGPVHVHTVLRFHIGNRITGRNALLLSADLLPVLLHWLLQWARRNKICYGSGDRCCFSDPNPCGVVDEQDNRQTVLYRSRYPLCNCSPDPCLLSLLSQGQKTFLLNMALPGSSLTSENEILQSAADKLNEAVGDIVSAM